jgi:mannosyltransferase OCH1-like enzyme
MNKTIFQTHKSMNYINSNPELLNATKSWKNHTNNFNYCFFNNQMCDDFIKQNFDETIYKAYLKLPMAVMKADLWRYCIIYHYGGIYADVDTICKVNPNIFINDALLTIVPENSIHLCQWVFSAPKGSPILKSIIDLSVKRILEIHEIKGEHIIHYLTGPCVFTNGIEQYLKENNKPVFLNDKKLYNNYPYSSILKVFDFKNFHENIVQHLFYGGKADGWCKERDIKLM